MSQTAKQATNTDTSSLILGIVIGLVVGFFLGVSVVATYDEKTGLLNYGVKPNE